VDVEGKRALTVADLLNALVVDEIDLSGYTARTEETIRVLASDDFQVTGVEVRIARGEGKILEEGEATPRVEGGWEWSYTTSPDVPEGEGSVHRSDRFPSAGAHGQSPGGGGGLAERDKVVSGRLSRGNLARRFRVGLSVAPPGGLQFIAERIIRTP